MLGGERFWKPLPFPAPSASVPVVPGAAPGLCWASPDHQSFSHLEASLRAQQQTCQAHTSFSRTCQPALPQSLAKFPRRRGGGGKPRGTQSGACSKDLQGRARRDSLGFPGLGAGRRSEQLRIFSAEVKTYRIIEARVVCDSQAALARSFPRPQATSFIGLFTYLFLEANCSCCPLGKRLRISVLP